MNTDDEATDEVEHLGTIGLCIRVTTTADAIAHVLVSDLAEEAEDEE